MYGQKRRQGRHLFTCRKTRPTFLSVTVNITGASADDTVTVRTQPYPALPPELPYFSPKLDSRLVPISNC